MAKTRIEDLPEGAAEMDADEQKAAKGAKRAGSAPNRPALGQRPPAPSLTGKLVR